MQICEKNFARAIVLTENWSQCNIWLQQIFWANWDGKYLGQ